MVEDKTNNQEAQNTDAQEQVEKTINIDLEKCTRCMACVANCPTKCIEEVNGDPVQTKPKDCIKCGTCVASCAVDAVELKE